jgi:type IX secretion system PorP/SprF family membrane protein
MKRLFTLVLFGLGIAAKVQGQDPEFSQFYANPLYLNPAMAGTAGGPRFAINFRDQWPSVSGAFVTYSASYDEHFDGLGGGIGAQVWHDQAGDGKLSTTYFSGIYSYHLTIKDQARDYFVIKAGLQAGAFQRTIDFSQLRFGDQIDPKLGFIYQTQEKLPSKDVYSTGLIPDFGAGVLAFSPKFYAGFAVAHIIEPAQSFFGNPNSHLLRKYTAHLGFMLPIDNWKRAPETFISPNLLVQHQGNFTQLNIGAYALKDFFLAGVWYRHTDPNSDALILMVGIKKDAIRIAYSYDLTVSDARAAAAGSHEISLIIESSKYNHSTKRKWRKINCPDNFGGHS